MKKSKAPDSPATIYNNMSHHYRRLFGAKAVVDSSAPFHLKNKSLQSHQRAASTQSLNKLSLCDSNRTSGSCTFHLDGRKKMSSSTMSLYSKSFVECPRYKGLRKPPSQKDDILDSLISNSEQPLFKPRILKSNTESKLRHLEKVYFPPRKKLVTMPAWESMNVEIETEDNLKPWIRNSTATVDKKPITPSHLSNANLTTDIGSQCSTSSKDSAYNEGEGNSSNEDGSRGPSPGYPNQQMSKSWSVQKAERRKEDALYVKFLRDITDDILNKGVYTNKGLKLVFQKHINENLNRLNLNRMKVEVDKLGEKIGIPKKDEDDKIDFGVGSICGGQELTKHEQPYGVAVTSSSGTRNAKPPTLSDIRQISKSLASSSSLDIEKELEALESYSDVELNEADILDTLAFFNINIKVLENETSIISTKHKPVILPEKIVDLPSKNEESNPVKNNVDGNLTDALEKQNLHKIPASNDNNIQEDHTGIKQSNSSNDMATKQSNSLNDTENIQSNSLNDTETQQSNSSNNTGTQQSNSSNELKENIGQHAQPKEAHVIEEKHDKDQNSNKKSNFVDEQNEHASKLHDVDLNRNKFKEINASLFHDTPHSQQKNKPSEEILDELEETNYSEDDFELHSDESGEEIEEDINEDSEIESVFSSEENSHS